MSQTLIELSQEDYDIVLNKPPYLRLTESGISEEGLAKIRAVVPKEIGLSDIVIGTFNEPRKIHINYLNVNPIT